MLAGPPPTATMLPVSLPVMNPPQQDSETDHRAAAAALAKQIELLNQQLVEHQRQILREKKRDEQLKQAEDLLRENGLNEEGDRMTKSELVALKESQESKPVVWADGPVWTCPQPLPPPALLQAVDQAKLKEIVDAMLEVDSSDSENEYDDIPDLDEESEDEEEEEGDEEEGEEEEKESKSAWEDDFPFEENLFRLSRYYDIVKRLATNDDAVVYMARQNTEPFLPVAIKITESDDDEKIPKAVLLLSAIQGHANLNRLICWHPLPSTDCYCIVTELVPNDLIFDFVVGRPASIKKYMLDTLAAVEHCQSRGVLFRDIKPDNIMWSHDRQCAVLIDFDVATFIRKQGHRAIVGSDGYMAPEIVAITKAKAAWKKETAKSQKQEKERKAEALRLKAQLARKGKFRATAASPNPKKLSEKLKDLSLSERSSPVSPNRTGDESDVSDSEAEEEDTERKRPSLTELGVNPYGIAVDVFSCGVVLGQLLFNISDEFVLDYPDSHADSMHEHFLRLVEKAEPYDIGYDLILRMTDKDPSTRITIPEVYKHPFFTGDEQGTQAILEAHEQQEETRKNGGMKCFGCNLTLPKEQFSKNQVKKKGGKVTSRRCLGCMKEE
jgi:serine/threonine protein kinase